VHHFQQVWKLSSMVFCQCFTLKGLGLLKVNVLAHANTSVASDHDKLHVILISVIKHDRQFSYQLLTENIVVNAVKTKIFGN